MLYNVYLMIVGHGVVIDVNVWKLNVGGAVN